MTQDAQNAALETGLRVVDYVGPTPEERANAVAYYRRPEQAYEYLRRCGVRRRLRKEAHRIDESRIPSECRDWLVWSRQGASMILCGPPGTGKSTAAVWCLRRLWLEAELVVSENPRAQPTWSAPKAEYMKTGELYDAVFERDAETLQRAEEIAVLVLDDWGAEYEHAWPLSRLDRVIDRRWEDALPTIVTTNMQPDEIKASLPRSYDRLTGRPGPGVVILDCETQRRREL